MTVARLLSATDAMQSNPRRIDSCVIDQRALAGARVRAEPPCSLLLYLQLAVIPRRRRLRPDRDLIVRPRSEPRVCSGAEWGLLRFQAGGRKGRET